MHKTIKAVSPVVVPKGYRQYKNPKLEKPTTAIVHKSAKIEPNVVLGNDVIVEEGARIYNGVNIGKGTVIAKNASIGSNTLIGKKCRINQGAYILQGVTIGNDVSIGSDASVECETTIDSDAWIASGISIGTEVHISEKTRIAVNIPDDVKTRAGCYYNSQTTSGGWLFSHSWFYYKHQNGTYWLSIGCQNWPISVWKKGAERIIVKHKQSESSAHKQKLVKQLKTMITLFESSKPK